MARQVRDARLETREARARLKARDEPYWRSIHEGLHLGYRKRVRGGVWLARLYHNGRYSKRGLGRADDTEDANGETVICFREAQHRALALGSDAFTVGPFTVAQALEGYLAWYATHRKALYATRRATEAHILPILGGRLVAELTTQELRDWHDALAKAPARVRTGRLDTIVKTREGAAPRARQATANRVLTILKAALNRAWHDGKVNLDDAWRRVKPFHDVGSVKVRYLSVAECTRLMNACTPDFRRLVQAALLTGCRYGELTRMVCGDYNPDAGAVLVRESKSGKPRHVPLTDEGRRFFDGSTAGCLGGDILFLRADGNPWGPAHQQRPLSRACEIAKITPAVSFHVLRHTYGSALAMRGVPLQVIAEVLGHADTRITSKHYAHLLPSYVADTVRANLPSFGVEAGNVEVLPVFQPIAIADSAAI